MLVVLGTHWSLLLRQEEVDVDMFALIIDSLFPGPNPQCISWRFLVSARINLAASGWLGYCVFFSLFKKNTSEFMNDWSLWFYYWFQMVRGREKYIG
jgi:hypothetical protein